MVTQFMQTVFDVFRQFISQLRVFCPQFVFRGSIRLGGGTVDKSGLLSSLNGSLESIFKI